MKRNSEGAGLRFGSFVRVFIHVIQADLSSQLLAVCGVLACKGKCNKYRGGTEKIRKEPKKSKGITNPHWLQN